MYMRLCFSKRGENVHIECFFLLLLHVIFLLQLYKIRQQSLTFFQVVQHEYIEYMSVILLSNKYLWNPLCNTKDEQNGD